METDKVQYDKIEIGIGSTLAECVYRLISLSAKGRMLCAEFNGHMFYSDKVSLDSAYKEMTGMGYAEFIQKQKQLRAKREQDERNYELSVPSLIPKWIEEGHKIIPKDKWDEWDKCVPIRLRDLYKGFDLRCCLDIISAINEASVDKGVSIMFNQGHSGMSWSLVKAMVRNFSDKGNEFCTLLEKKEKEIQENGR